MANSYHSSGRPTLLSIETDGQTIVNVYANSSTHSLNTSDGASGTDNGPRESRHDENHIPILMATSSADGATPVAVYTDSSGNLLIDSI